MSQSENQNNIKKPKICFLLDHPKENHYKFDNNNVPQNVYLSTYPGRTLKALTGKDGLQLDKDQWYFDYAYSKMPKVTKRDRYGKALSYKPTSAKEEKEEFPFTEERVLKEKPDVIIPMGNVACSFIFNKKSITALRGKPEQRLLAEGYEPWVLPTFSPEYILAQPNSANLVNADLSTLDKYLKKGDKAFTPDDVVYEFVDSMERVREIFSTIIPKADVVAWDLETNTLKPWIKGAKAIVLSLSTKEGEGFTIPLEHKEFTKWSKEDVDEIYSLLKELLEDSTRTKVGHNIKFDQKFLQLTRGFDTFKNNLDTKVMYYLLINQEVESSLRLSDLSYEITTIGGYDKGLEDFKKEFKDNEKEQAKLEAEEKYNIAVEEWKENGKDKKEPKPKKADFPPTSSKVNEIDGSDFNYEWIPLIEMLHPYASGDTDACIRIYNHLDNIGNKLPHLKELYTNFYPKLDEALTNIESNGAKLDVDYNIEMSKAYDKEVERLAESIREFPQVKEVEEERQYLFEKGLAEWAKPKLTPALKKKLEKEGVDIENLNPDDYRDEDVAKLRDKYKDKIAFNPSSPEMKGILFYRHMQFSLPFDKEHLKDSALQKGLKESEVTYKDYKTDTTALAYMIENTDNEKHKELLQTFLSYSALSKIQSNYTHKLRNLVSDKELIHANFNSTATVTSRLASNQPNMQNISSPSSNPKDFSYKYPIKKMFVSRFEKGVILNADYSGLEMAIAALKSKDEAMIDALLNEKDMHTETATLIFNCKPEEVTKTMRKLSKSVSFGLLYGETAMSFAPKQNISVKEAEDIFEQYYRNKPKVKQAIDETHALVKKYGYVETMAGFRRNLRNIYSSENSKKNKALRESFNTIIQGTGAFLTNFAVIRLNEWMKSKNLQSKLIMTVHDSIVVDCHPSEVQIVAKASKLIMENLPLDWLFIEWEGEKIRFPIRADIGIGRDYSEEAEYDAELYKQFNSGIGYCKYFNDLKYVKDYLENELITEEKYNQLKSSIESKIEKYKLI